MTKEEQNLLDLREKTKPEVVFVERIVLKNRLWYIEAIKTLAIIIVVSAVVWGVSNAESFIAPLKSQQEVKNFSAMGTVSDIATTTISINNAKGSDGSGKSSYTFDIDPLVLPTIKTKNDTDISFQDINIGDRIITQGVDDSGNISILKIISLSTSTTKDIATSTDVVATTTDAATTSTPTNASSTDTSTSSTSTDETSSSTVIDTLKNIVGNVVDAIIGTSTATDTSTTNNSTTTSASSTDSTSTIIDTITSAVKDTITNVVNTVTGNNNSSTTPPDTSASTTPAPTTDTPPAPAAPTPVDSTTQTQ